MSTPDREPIRNRSRQIPVVVESGLAPQREADVAHRCADHSAGEPKWSVAPVEPLGVIDGHRVLRVGNELLFSSDSIVDLKKLQCYPGQALRNLDGMSEFPVPHSVGQYCSREEFELLPMYMAQWVHWPKRVEMVLEGRYHELPPVHMEGIFTLVCNFMCPHCSRHVTRTKWVEGGTWDNNTKVEQANTLHPDDLKRVIDELATMRVDEQMGIVWGGGDPTANPFTYDAMLYARRKGITASFLTNGVFLDVQRCLDADPILIRVSLNCGTEEAYRRFHGYPRGWDYFERVKLKMRELVREKRRRGARTLIGISLIMDERNMEDTVAAADEIGAVVEEAGPGIDYVIVRPVFDYATSRHVQLNHDTKAKARQLISVGGAIWTRMRDLGIPLVPIKDSYDEPPGPDLYHDTRCLAYGMCGEIRHNGDVQLCSDSYGNPEYTIGNLRESSIKEIWASPRRQEVLERINAKACYQTYCPHNSRGHHFNRLFHQIERFRAQNRLPEVQKWIESLRRVSFPMGHSFFI